MTATALTRRTPLAVHFLSAIAFVLIASALGGGIAGFGALVGVTIVAWAHKEVARSVAIALTVLTTVVGVAVLLGWTASTGMTSSHTSGVSRHVGHDRVPPAP